MQKKCKVLTVNYLCDLQICRYNLRLLKERRKGVITSGSHVTKENKALQNYVIKNYKTVKKIQTEL